MDSNISVDDIVENSVIKDLEVLSLKPTITSNLYQCITISDLDTNIIYYVVQNGDVRYLIPFKGYDRTNYHIDDPNAYALFIIDFQLIKFLYPKQYLEILTHHKIEHIFDIPESINFYKVLDGEISKCNYFTKKFYTKDDIDIGSSKRDNATYYMINFLSINYPLVFEKIDIASVMERVNEIQKRGKLFRNKEVPSKGFVIAFDLNEHILLWKELTAVSKDEYMGLYRELNTYTRRDWGFNCS